MELPVRSGSVWGKSDLPQNRLNRFWHEADIDGNGVIDFQEFTESLGIRFFNGGILGTYNHERLSKWTLGSQTW